MTEPTICPEGHYCPPGSQTKEVCPAGKFSDLKGLKSAAECQLGAYGKYYASTAMTAASAGVNCNSKYKCYHTDADLLNVNY